MRIGVRVCKRTLSVNRHKRTWKKDLNFGSDMQGNEPTNTKEGLIHKLVEGGLDKRTPSYPSDGNVCRLH